VRTILLVAAERLEFAGLLSRLTGVTEISCGSEYAACADVGGDRWVLAANGPGPRLAAEAAAAACRDRAPDIVVSTGFCGALDPHLALADIVVAERVLGDRGSYPARLPRTSRPHARGAVLSQCSVAVTVADKRRLRQSGACAVEMEAYGLAERASNWGSDFYCIRAVSDRADEDLPMDFNAVRDPSGRFDRMRIARAALARPLERVPRLWRMRRNCRQAAEQLGEFLADCRF
jgi:adenosylhomocysteine nucleosidase